MNEKKVYTVLSIDPGIHSFGYAVSNINTEVFHQTVIGCDTLYPSKPENKALRKDSRSYNDKIISCGQIQTAVRYLCHMYNPDYVTSENAFFNPTRPQAYACLLLSIFTIEHTLYDIYKEGKRPLQESASRLYKMAPKIIKATISTNKGGDAIKNDMTSAVLDKVVNKEISFYNYPNDNIDLNDFTEHSIDAISIGYTFSKMWLPMLLSKAIKNNVLALTSKDLKSFKKELHIKS